MTARMKIRPLLIAGMAAAMLPLVSGAQDLPTVAKPLQRNVELTCRLDIFTPMLYEGITTEIGGSKTVLTFNKSCAELQGQEYMVKDGRASFHPKSLLTWDKGLLSAQVRVNDQVLDIPRGEFRKSLRVISIGRMSVVDFGKVAHVYDNTEQHWCPFALKFPASDAKSLPLYWYDKNSQNVIRFYQGSWGAGINKTQHYLPAACSSSQTPMPPKPVHFKFGKDLPVNVHTGPVVVTY
jgi:hypothetical protein